jgi:hypothetical protein
MMINMETTQAPVVDQPEQRKQTESEIGRSFHEEYIDLLVKSGHLPQGSVFLTGIKPDATMSEQQAVDLSKNQAGENTSVVSWPRLFNSDGLVDGGKMLFAVPNNESTGEPQPVKVPEDGSDNPNVNFRIDMTREHLQLLMDAGELPVGSEFISGVTPDPITNSVEGDVKYMKAHSELKYNDIRVVPRLFDRYNQIVDGGVTLVGVPNPDEHSRTT